MNEKTEAESVNVTASLIDRVGTSLRKLPNDSADFLSALKIANEWRLSHTVPLKIIRSALSKKARRLDGSAIVAQRLKRLPSILSKLGRGSTRLSEMQDLGGCRAVLEKLSDVEELFRQCQKIGSHSVLWSKDYVENPKANGYRSKHVVVGFHGKKELGLEGRRIEIQIRSRLQHLWATAVEVCDTFAGENLKFSTAPNTMWGRFFALMGSAIAARECKASVPGTPESASERKEQLVQLVAETKIMESLHSWVLTVEPAGIKKGEMYLLMLDGRERRTTLWSYSKDRLAAASADYLEMEKKKANDRDFQAVLISVDSLDAIRKAYPNYFIDVFEFMEVVASELGGRICMPKINRNDKIPTIKSSEPPGLY